MTMRCKEAAAAASASSSYYSSAGAITSSHFSSKRGREEEEEDGSDEQQLSGLLGEAIKALEAAELACGDEFDKLVFANSTLSREEAFMADHFPTTGDQIAYLNVGGQPIATHAATLRAFEESMLATLFGKEEWIVQEKDLDDDGNYCLIDHIDFATFQKVSSNQ